MNKFRAGYNESLAFKAGGLKNAILNGIQNGIQNGTQKEKNSKRNPKQKSSTQSNNGLIERVSRWSKSQTINQCTQFT